MGASTRTSDWWNLPNQLTLSRFVMAALLFVLIAFEQWLGCLIVFLVAAVTDWLDGYLARRWKVEGAFGRVVDPYVDKVLVIGSFIFFAGKNFIIADPSPGPASRFVVQTITGVAPWMVVVILARELLVTSFRGLGEGAGQQFGAAFSGKVKMVVQSVTILVVLVYVNYFAPRRGSTAEHALGFVRDLCVWTTVAVTVLSGLAYVRRALAVAARQRETIAAGIDD